MGLSRCICPPHSEASLGIIQNIWPSQIDTRLTSFDKNAEQTYRPTTGWFARNAATTNDYTFSNGDIIGSTSNHPFFSIKTSTFVPIGDFEIGDAVQLADGAVAQLTDVAERGVEAERVYNLEDWREQVYYVGSGVLVHNSCWTASQLAKKTAAELVGIKKKFSDDFKLLHGVSWNSPCPSKWKFDDVPDGYMFYVESKGGKKVFFNNAGLPDFKPHCLGKDYCFHRPGGYVGNYTTDMTKTFDHLKAKFGNRITEFNSGKRSCKIDGAVHTFHHHEDLKTIMAVRKDAHLEVQHIGKSLKNPEMKIFYLSPYNF